MVSSLDPRYSPTPLPGYVANNPWAPGPNGATPTGVNHPAWQTNVITALAVDWASGGRGLPGGWDSSFGTPDPSDSNGKPTARTISAFTKYVQAYKPGTSEWLDSNFPYVPPGPGDYVESPDTIALRVDQENWEKMFDVQYGPTAQADKAAALAQHQYEFGEQLKLDQARLAMQGSAQASEAAYQSAKLALEREGLSAEAAWRKSQLELEREKMRVGEEQFNKTLALQYENLWLAKEEAADRKALAVADIQQKRANTLAELGADPGDAVQRELFSRLGSEPLGTPVDVFTGQPGATDSMTLSQVMAGQADKLRPFAQRGFSGSPVNTQSGLVTDSLAVVGDSPSGQETGTEELFVNPTNAPVGFISNKDVKKMGLRDVVRGARPPRYARGTMPVSPYGNSGNYGNDNRTFPMPRPMPRFSEMFRGMAQRPVRRFADGTLNPDPAQGLDLLSGLAPMESYNQANPDKPIPVVNTQAIGPVTQVEPKPAAAPAATPKWELVTAPDGKAVWYDGATGKYYDPNTKAEIPSPAGMTKGKPDPVALPAPTPPTPPKWTARPNEIYSAANGDQWRENNGQWIFAGNDPKVPPTKPPMTTPGNPNALTPYWGGWWDEATQGPVPRQAPPMNAAPTTGFATNRQRSSLANPRTLSSILSRRNRGDEGGDETTDTTLADGTVVDRNGRTRGRGPGNGLPPPVTIQPVPGPTTQPPPAGTTPPAGGTTGNALLDALAQSAGIDILSYGPEVYQALAKLLNQPGIAEQLAANGINVPALGLTGDNALPAPNALNYTNLSDLQNNAPGSFALLSSLFKAGNQNLPNLVAGVKARAPRGSAYNPSLIST